MNKILANDEPAVYRIIVSGLLDDSWSDWLDGFTIKAEIDRTTITGVIADQVCLRGILERLWDLNFELISVNRTEEYFFDGRMKFEEC
jgi:hypothetical protein